MLKTSLPAFGLAIALGTVAAGPSVRAAAPASDTTAFRALYKELVETNTTLSAGDCTLAAQRMGARLKAVGYPETDVRVIVADGHPKEGSLFAVLKGSDPSAKAMLLLAHIDVVEAKREDWERDPFTLVEENGYFYARGASDDKAQAAIWVDTLVRLKQEGFKPRRDIKLALTCGEETSTAFNGAEYLATKERALIDAEFALNEGAGGRLDADGKRLLLNVEAGQKFPQNYNLEITNPGGHSSRPVKKNAIVQLSAALVRANAYDFPIQFTDASKAYFTEMSKLTPGPMGPAMAALVKNPADKAAAKIVTADPGFNGMLRTTCVATMIDGGHAENALPQRAHALINCRIFPGVTVEAVKAQIEKLLADPEIKVTLGKARSPVAKAPPPLSDQFMGPIRTVAAEVFPGVPIVPVLTAGATDGAFLTPAGIPTYGLTGIFGDPDGNGVHGLNERIRVRSLYEGREFLYRVVKLYAAQGPAR
jgi:acetylornithine deacetylase/succinyl-diaminopimelate desuccinylase-like protein